MFQTCLPTIPRYEQQNLFSCINFLVMRNCFPLYCLSSLCSFSLIPSTSCMLKLKQSRQHSSGLSVVRLFLLQDATFTILLHKHNELFISSPLNVKCPQIDSIFFPSSLQQKSKIQRKSYPFHVSWNKLLLQESISCYLFQKIVEVTVVIETVLSRSSQGTLVNFWKLELN